MTILHGDLNIAIIGLGYVGLPLAVEFGKNRRVVGFDISEKRIAELKTGRDSILEVDVTELREAIQLSYTNDPRDLRDCNVFIITVPTPIDEHKRPDLSYIEAASRTVGQMLELNNVVIYESTVYPGCTEEICVPILERESGIKCIFSPSHPEGQDQPDEGFFVGYSPERINPGDKEHRLTNTKKVTSGSTSEAADFIDALYASIVTAGTHKVSKIKVAEAAKVIENTQRDLNIALVNELAIIFHRLDIDTEEVLEAAGSKWNFLPFRPGLVGGHCIGVDPYYLTHKAQAVGYLPEIILSGRRINDNMGSYVAEQVVKLMTQKRIHVVDANILVMGLAFKENCPDIRNTRVVDIIKEFKNYNARVDVYDPWVDKAEAENEYGITLVDNLRKNKYDAIIVAVAHREFKGMGVETIRSFGKITHVLYDIKYVIQAEYVDGRL